MTVWIKMKLCVHRSSLSQLTSVPKEKLTSHLCVSVTKELPRPTAAVCTDELPTEKPARSRSPERTNWTNSSVMHTFLTYLPLFTVSRQDRHTGGAWTASWPHDTSDSSCASRWLNLTVISLINTTNTLITIHKNPDLTIMVDVKHYQTLLYNVCYCSVWSLSKTDTKEFKMSLNTTFIAFINIM